MSYDFLKNLQSKFVDPSKVEFYKDNGFNVKIPDVPDVDVEPKRNWFKIVRDVVAILGGIATVITLIYNFAK